jgi:two-component system probable response regulator PhcQ
VTQDKTHKATILLVDDEPNITEALKRALRKEPYLFLTATSGAEAEKLLETQHVDAIISDEQMPVMSGSEFLARARKRFPNTIRMVLSGQASLEAAVRAINEGEVYRFFLKPVNPTDLAFTIRQALEHKRLEEQSRRLLREFQKQATTLARIKRESETILHLDTDDQGAILLDEDECNVTDLLAEMEDAMQKNTAGQTTAAD